LNGLATALIAIIVRPTGGLGTKYGVRFPRGERRDLVGTGARGTHGIWRNRQAISPEPVAFSVTNRAEIPRSGLYVRQLKAASGNSPKRLGERIGVLSTIDMKESQTSSFARARIPGSPFSFF